MRGQIQSRNDYLDADMDDLTMLSDTPKAAKEDKPQYTDTETQTDDQTPQMIA